LKVYNEIVFDVDGNVIYEDSYEYSGDLAYCAIATDPEAELADPSTTGGTSSFFDIIEGDPGSFDVAVEGSVARTGTTVLPSLPSISNLGSTPFTSTVSHIPGGFQPLPQVAGQRKKLYQLSQFHGGLNQKSSPRDIADIECQEAINVTVSEIGRIKLLGDCLNENAIGADIGADDQHDGFPGYGLFQFVAPANHNGTVTGEHVFTCTSNGDEIDIYNTPNTDGIQAGWISFSGDDNTDNAHVFYASGNGLYVTDSNFDNTNNSSQAKVYVSRRDINGAVSVSGWKKGKPLIDSPDEGSSTANVMHEANTDGSIVAEGHAGSMTVMTQDTGTGTWGAAAATTYEFYVSWLFDGGVETGLSNIGEDTFDSETCVFNVSLMHTNAAPLGADKRIEGARIYFKAQGSAERFILAEVSLVDGVRGALDSTFTPWSGSNPYTLDSNITFKSPPELYTYSSENGTIYASEVYTKSPDAPGTIPTAKDVRYKTAVVGSGGIVFIGNVKFDGKHMPDSMMFSMPGKPGYFPQYNRFDSPSSDGSPITALAAYRDTILQFKENGMYVINISNGPGAEYTQASFRDCGVFNPCQVFTASFGVIFANKFGCYIYDGQKVISLTGGKFDWLNQSDITEETSNASTANFPCVGYDPRSKSIVVLKDIGDDTGTTSLTNQGAWIYNMVTQSWTEGSDMITNGDGRRHTNFIITNDGYLAIKRDNDGTLLNYNHDMQTDTNSTASAQSIEYITKDLDFGLPSQTKKIFKVYVTYKGDCDGISVYFRADGNATDRQFNSTNTPLSDVGSTLTTVALTPTTASQAKDIKSFALRFTGEVGVDSADAFEINDISILYRARPIK
jgi:hypothetical protein